MAKEYMDAQQAITTTLFQKAVEIGEKSIKDMPTLYTVDELTEKAKEMYNFVSKKD
jgi:hypothetical protein|tara:strand:- start:1 stop:168 length:168 start_codon:yes stop_codon:yes gene_type:complete